MDSRTIMIVEPHDDTRELYAEYLRLRGFNVNTFSAPDEALPHTHTARAVVTAPALGGPIDGIRFIERTRQREAHREDADTATPYPV